VTVSHLRDTLETHADITGRPLKELTVMGSNTDPYRLDTPANHRDAKWFAEAWESCGAGRPLHLRGLHYAFISFPGLPLIPNGQRYLNTKDCWEWLQAISSPARWLGYVEFTDVIDQRNSPPIIHYAPEYDTEIECSTSAMGPPTPFSLETHISWPKVEKGAIRQAYRLVVIGEKQSILAAIDGLREAFRLEVVLPTGELSTTLLHGILQRADDDGRPCRIFYISDFDPTGFHMPVEVSRKVQAMVDAFFPALDVQVHRCALTAEQVKELGLPSTPMKESERRADKWRERFGVEQTEIDALVTLKPRVMRKILREAIAPYWDSDLSARVAAEEERIEAAVLEARFASIDTCRSHAGPELQAAADAALAAEKALRDAASEVLTMIDAELEARVRAIVARIEMPEPEPEGDVEDALFCSDREWVEQTRTLIEERL
jgi:hypothetical protein